MRQGGQAFNRQGGEPSPERLTINDVARLAGVSKKSVSRVINDEPGVSDDTRSKIRALMQELGFIPSRKARALATSKSFLLGLVHNNPNAAYVMELALGAQIVAGEKGFEVIVHAARGVALDDLRNDIKQFAARAGCDGLLLLPPLSESVSLVVDLAALQVPLVRIAGDESDLRVRQIRCREQPAIFDLVNRLLQKGHTNFAFLGGASKSNSTRRRLSAVSDVLFATNGRARLLQIEFGDYTFASGLRLGAEILHANPDVTAIVCANDEIAAGVVHATLSKGVDIPGKVMVTGFDDAPLAMQMWPPITSVRQPIRAMAARAVEVLLDPKLPVDHVEVFACTVIERQSTGLTETADDPSDNAHGY